MGEGPLYGEDTTGMRFLEGYHTDAFHFKAQVVELRRKPSVPIGEHGRDGKGDLPEYPDRGVHLRAICAAGMQAGLVLNPKRRWNRPCRTWPKFRSCC